MKKESLKQFYYCKRCRLPCEVKVSITKQNPNREFYACQCIEGSIFRAWCDNVEFYPSYARNLVSFIKKFEEGWNKMLEHYKINNTGHWKVMYECRSDWVPAYFQGTFFAEMSTTQRSESMNAMLKLWLNNHTSIYQFVQKIENMIEGIWHNESDEDIKNIHETPRLWSPYPIERSVRSVYTRKNFVVFKEILMQSCLGVVVELESDRKYEVKVKVNQLTSNWKEESFMVEVDKEAETFSCSCKGFEFEGFLCPHAIKVLLHFSLEHIPEKYILRRWCKGVNDNAKKSVRERCKESDGSDMVLELRKKTLRIQYNDIEELSARSVAGFEMALSRLTELKNDLKSFGQLQLEQQVAENETETEVVQMIELERETYLDPPISQTKGRKKKPVRWKPTVEKTLKKGRKCGYCGSKEAHNIRTCPKRLSDKTRGKKYEVDEGDMEDDSLEESSS